MHVLRLLFIFLAFMVIAQPSPAADDAELLKVVVLSRHGVRAPTQDEKLLEIWSQKQWPVWPVGKGELTPRGAKLVTAMWSNLGATLRKSRLLENESCPQNIYVRADTDERTKATAHAILNGLAPGCDLGYHVAENKMDPLFHPVKAGLYRYDAIAVATDVLAQTNGGIDRLQDQFSGALSLMSSISGPPSPALCARFALMPKCNISELPNAISISSDGTGIRLVGALGIASSMAEIYLLEYGEWPGQAAGWGQVDGRVLSQILPLHSRIFDVINRAAVVAWANGSSLAREMTNALFNNHYDKRANDAKLVIFVGHDTNIANVGALFGFEWQASGYPANGIPPASALFLELWRKGGHDYVVPRFLAQTPKALHTEIKNGESELSAFAPVVAVITADGTSASYPADTFRHMVKEITSGAPMAPNVTLK